MSLYEAFKRKMPATFNAAEYETERVLNRLDQHAGQADDTARVMEIVQEKINRQSEVLEDFRKETGRQLDEMVQLLKSVLEQYDSLSRRFAHLEGDLHWRADRLEKVEIRHTPWPVLSFEVALVEHCNLKCAGCDHFSPVAEPEFADIKEFTRDFERLSELFSGKAREIHLLGGEPLLHPDLAGFLQTARRCFPQAVIDVTTNGLLLPRMGEAFWEVCHQERIVVRPTKYPEESIDYNAAEKLAAQYGVEYRYIDNTGQTVKTLTKYPLDLKGLQDPRRSFMLCHRANACIYLQRGRLFTCTVAPTICHLNRHFGTHFEEDPANSIDIYQVASADEILDYLAHPIPFCRYCMPESAQEGQPWRQSKKELSEWV